MHDVDENETTMCYLQMATYTVNNYIYLLGRNLNGKYITRGIGSDLTRLTDNVYYCDYGSISGLINRTLISRGFLKNAIASYE